MSEKLFLVAADFKNKLKKQAGLVKVPEWLIEQLSGIGIAFFNRCCYELYQKFLTKYKLSEERKLELRLLFEKFKSDSGAIQEGAVKFPSEKILKFEFGFEFNCLYDFLIVAGGFGITPTEDFDFGGELECYEVDLDTMSKENFNFGKVKINITDYLFNIIDKMLHKKSIIEIANYLNYSHQEIKRIAKHELTHLLQHINQTMKEFNFGYSSNKINDFLDYPDESVVKENQKKYDKEHTLQDDEFYTNLVDSINDFKSNIKYFPKSLHEFILNYCLLHISKVEFKDQYYQVIDKAERGRLKNHLIKMISIRKMFNILKENNFDKYKKAAKEFYKAVQDF